ncbi:hypothetical protein [Leifsonia sp. LS-T14]|uniref:hypothetical protein n=1 Tax=unclassified Leifsonia TaxID=2663824 RepID=UPI0035A5AF73
MTPLDVAGAGFAPGAMITVTGQLTERTQYTSQTQVVAQPDGSFAAQLPCNLPGERYLLPTEDFQVTATDGTTSVTETVDVRNARAIDGAQWLSTAQLSDPGAGVDVHSSLGYAPGDEVIIAAETGGAADAPTFAPIRVFADKHGGVTAHVVYTSGTLREGNPVLTFTHVTTGRIDRLVLWVFGGDVVITGVGTPSVNVPSPFARATTPGRRLPVVSG